MPACWVGVVQALETDGAALVAALLPGSMIGLGAVAGPIDTVDRPIALSRLDKLVADAALLPKFVRFDVLAEVTALLQIGGGFE